MGVRKRVKVKLPQLHPGQAAIDLKRFTVITCGRRWGKTEFVLYQIVHALLEKKRVSLWLPDYSNFQIYWDRLMVLLPPQLIKSKNFNLKALKMKNGGFLKAYSLHNGTSKVGRGEKFHMAVIDEAAFIMDLRNAWEAIIRPMLVDYAGSAIIVGTPFGKNFFYTLSQLHKVDDQWGYYSAPTTDNPHLPESERLEIIEKIKKAPNNQLLRQEYLAEFIESGGSVFSQLKPVTSTKETIGYRIGIDLAKSQDYTVVSVFNDHNQQVYFERWNTESWTQITERIRRILDKYDRKEVIVDRTGVGSPICDQLIKDGYNITLFNFSNKSKEALIENLALLIDNSEMEFLLEGANNEDIQVLEFQSFMRHLDNGRIKYKSDFTDDCIMAAGLAMSTEPYRMAGVY